ncbi:hypothetical protein CRG98_013404 [Punica granatum]|uniref:Uncharacterized protein n=1 Tax=Punica granatum TaxID=22663 RepID=A0A2I0KEK7_PUNGR|nr:hypothetical protein CRG98_013404 [Punica granatum]
MKIFNQREKENLAEAKQRTYLKGFSEGTMLVGDYTGMKVQESKPLIRNMLIETDQAIMYSEPEKRVMSRSVHTQNPPIFLHQSSQMKQEFEYWYPFELRVSGKDLIQNHLTFCIYNHTAIMSKPHWPRGFRLLRDFQLMPLEFLSPMLVMARMMPILYLVCESTDIQHCNEPLGWSSLIIDARLDNWTRLTLQSECPRSNIRIICSVKLSRLAFMIFKLQGTGTDSPVVVYGRADTAHCIFLPSLCRFKFKKDETIALRVQALDLKLPFREVEVLRENLDLIKRQIGLEEVEVLSAADPDALAGAGTLVSLLNQTPPSPGKPIAIFLLS